MDQSRIIAASSIALAVTLFAIFSMRPWARRVGLVDRPDDRKQHAGRVPVIGGICFFVGVIVGLGYLGNFDRFVMSLMLGSALIVAVGVADDLSNLSVRTRLLIESAIVALVILSTGYYVNQIGGLAPSVDLRLGILGIPLTIVAVIGLINAFNMLDGIDGLAASMAMVCIMAILMHDRAGWASIGVMAMLQILFAALIPYVFVNLGWPDGRKIFMGDAGSTVIGFLLGWSLIYLSHPSVSRLQPTDVLWCVAFPLMDTLAVMYRRIRLGRSPFEADRQHLHHLLVDRGFSTRGALLAIVLTGVALVSLGHLLRDAPEPWSFVVFVAMTLAYLVGLPRLLDTVARYLPRELGQQSARAASHDDGAHHAQASQPAQERKLIVLPPVDRPAVEAPSSGMAPIHGLCLLSAAPEEIGAASLVRKLAQDDRFRITLCLPESRRDEIESLLGVFDLHAVRSLRAGRNGQPASDDGSPQAEIQHLLDEAAPDFVMLPSDGPLTFAMSLAAHARNAQVVCMDADALPPSAQYWPNDASRRIVQSLAALHVVPGEMARQRLAKEGVPASSLLVAGEIAGETVDIALRRMRLDAGLNRAQARKFPFLGAGSLLLASAPQMAMDGPLPDALARVARHRPDIDIVLTGGFGMSSGVDDGPFRDSANVHVLSSIDYLAWVYLLDRSHTILAEPGSFLLGRRLGKPVLTLRDEPAGGALADRILTLLADRTAYLAACEPADRDAAARQDGCLPVVEALANLHALADARLEAGYDRYAFGAKVAS